MNGTDIFALVALVFGFLLLLGLPIAGFLLWCKKVYARRKEFWMSAADSLGLSFIQGKRSWSRGYMYSLEGEYNGHSIHVCLEMEGSGESARGYTVYKLKCPEFLEQRAMDGGLNGVVARVSDCEVVFSDGDFKLRSNGYAKDASEIISTVRQLVDSVIKIEGSPFSP